MTTVSVPAGAAGTVAAAERAVRGMAAEEHCERRLLGGLYYVFLCTTDNTQ